MSGTRGLGPSKTFLGVQCVGAGPTLCVQVPASRQPGLLCALGRGGESAPLRVISGMGAPVRGAVPPRTCVGHPWCWVGGLGRVRPASSSTCFPNLVPSEAN